MSLQSNSSRGKAHVTLQFEMSQRHPLAPANQLVTITVIAQVKRPLFPLGCRGKRNSGSPFDNWKGSLLSVMTKAFRERTKADYFPVEQKRLMCLSAWTEGFDNIL